jgi:Methyltransferase FkbM domain
MTTSESDRVRIAATCRDADYIPKVTNAGSVFRDSNGDAIQLMHNGVRVLAEGYYGHFNSEIVKELKGHHEPQEERAFFEVLKSIKPGGVMIELGAYWSYYSLWFNTSNPGAKCYMLEPVAKNLDIGKRNFAINGFQGEFVRAFVSDVQSPYTDPPTITIDGFARERDLKRIEILHSDIQGHEYAMLLGAKELFGNKLVRFAFISTHGYKVHAQCLGFLRRRGYKILAEHTTGESYSIDGLIVAGVDHAMRHIKVTRKKQSLTEQAKSLACRCLAYFVG